MRNLFRRKPAGPKNTYKKPRRRQLEFEPLEWRYGPTPSVEMGLTAVGVAAANPFSQPALPPALLAHPRETAVSVPVHAVPAVPEGAPPVVIIPSQLQVVTSQSTPPRDEAAPPARPFGGGRDFEKPFFEDLAAEGELLLQAARPRRPHTDGIPQGGGGGGGRGAAFAPPGPREPNRDVRTRSPRQLRDR